MSLFERVTRAKLKDCITDQNNNMIFIVQPAQISIAIGKKGVNAKKITTMINRKIKIVEFNPDLLQFVRNLVLPVEVTDVEQEDKTVIITGKDTKTKGLMIGRDARNLREIESIVKRYFDIDSIKVR